VFAIMPAAAFATPARSAGLLKTTIPSTMVAGSTYKVVIQMKNTGRYSWRYLYNSRLKALGSDPFTTVVSYRVGKTQIITHDHSITFTITMKAPSRAGTYVTDWRMYRNNLAFGAIVSRKVTVVPVALSSIALTKFPSKVHYLTGDRLDLSGMVVTGTYNNGTKKVLSVSSADVSGFDSHAVAAAQTLTVTVGGKAAKFTIDITEKKPVISAVHFSSNSAKGSSVAANGDIVTLTFTSDEPVTKLSNFKVNGSNPDTFTNVGNVYTATHLVDSGDHITGDPATFQINVKNALGFYSQTIEATNDHSSVTIVDEKPVISAVHFSSNSAKGSSVAANGDIVTLTFTSDEPVTKLSSFKVNGSNPDTFTNVGNVYTATHLVDSGDHITGDPATFQINVKNAAGIFSQTIEATNDDSSVTIVDEKPVISAVHISSNSADGADKTANGDVISLTFTSDEPVTKLTAFKINGSNPDTFTHEGNVYTATHLVDGGDPVTGSPATFQINVKNAAGIFSQTIEATGDGSSVTIVHPKPVISAVHISSNSIGGPSVAANGDIITLTFTSDQPVTKLGNFKINGSNPASFTNEGNVYTATHLVDDGDHITGAPADFQINVQNLSGIYSQTIEVTNDGSSVTIVANN
jgi:succinyl-CoA synthetase beta subunit